MFIFKSEMSEAPAIKVVSLLNDKYYSKMNSRSSLPSLNTILFLNELVKQIPLLSFKSHILYRNVRRGQ